MKLIVIDVLNLIKKVEVRVVVINSVNLKIKDINNNI